MTDILDRILQHKRAEIAETRKVRPLELLRERVAEAPPVRDFVAALKRKSAGAADRGDSSACDSRTDTSARATAQEIALIAEVKKASPSAGLIREDFDPTEIARIYERHGAACISCLTDEHFFQGCLDDLRAVRAAVSLPVLRKDFVIDRFQVLEAREAGADCVLLIAECLDDGQLEDLYQETAEWGMQALIEIYEPANLDRVLKLNPPLLGVNNRNLKTFVTDLNHTTSLAARLPSDCLLVSESGIRTRQDVLHLQRAGVHAILVGETLMRSPDIGAQVGELLGSRIV